MLAVSSQGCGSGGTESLFNWRKNQHLPLPLVQGLRRLREFPPDRRKRGMASASAIISLSAADPTAPRERINKDLIFGCKLSCFLQHLQKINARKKWFFAANILTCRKCKAKQSTPHSYTAKWRIFFADSGTLNFLLCSANPQKTRRRLNNYLSIMMYLIFKKTDKKCTKYIKTHKKR